MAQSGKAGGGAPRARSWARRLAMQALYQWQLTQHDLGVIDAQFQADPDMERADLRYFQELLHQIPSRLGVIDASLAPFLDRPVEQIDPVERAILWIGGYELGFRRELPYRVAINEGVELAKTFGAEQGHKFVNGVLDRAAQALRADEVAARAKRPSR